MIDRDGTIYRLVPPSIICRHTVGLNYTAIGIEHVGTSDGQILDDRRQLDASLRLTLWLMSRYGIRLRNVIGHNESLTSPYHRERYPRLAMPDARRLDAGRHADLPRGARTAGAPLRRAARASGPSRRLGLLRLGGAASRASVRRHASRWPGARTAGSFSSSTNSRSGRKRSFRTTSPSLIAANVPSRTSCFRSFRPA